MFRHLWGLALVFTTSMAFPCSFVEPDRISKEEKAAFFSAIEEKFGELSHGNAYRSMRFYRSYESTVFIQFQPFDKGLLRHYYKLQCQALFDEEHGEWQCGEKELYTGIQTKYGLIEIAPGVDENMALRAMGYLEKMYKAGIRPKDGRKLKRQDMKKLESIRQRGNEIIFSFSSGHACESHGAGIRMTDGLGEPFEFLWHSGPHWVL